MSQCLVGLCIYTCRTLGLDLVVRDPEASIIDPDSTGVIELYRRVRLIKISKKLSVPVHCHKKPV